jgi:uncharacterized protein
MLAGIGSRPMSNEHEFSIAARDLDAGGRSIHFPVRATWIRGALEGTNVGPAGPDGTLDLRVSRSGMDVVVRGNLGAELTVPCARCLEPARITVREPISALVVPATELRESPDAGDVEGAVPDQADVIGYDGETVVLDDLVRDELVLGIPMIPLCSEGCPGIRRDTESSPRVPSPEADGSIDPRLRPLLRLKNPSTP